MANKAFVVLEKDRINIYVDRQRSKLLITLLLLRAHVAPSNRKPEQFYIKARRSTLNCVFDALLVFFFFRWPTATR